MRTIQKKILLPIWLRKIILLLLFPRLVIEDFIKHPKEFKLRFHLTAFQIIWQMQKTTAFQDFIKK
jgi:hypothetical protein